jgi:hypothetical protein
MDKTVAAEKAKGMRAVARMVKERRAQHGAEHVNECWRRGVIGDEPGYFYAAEGGEHVGVLPDDPVIRRFAELELSPAQALLVMKEPAA